MKKRILSFFLATVMVMSAIIMLGVSATAETVIATETTDNVLHISNSDTEDRFWCEVSTSLQSGISDGYVEFDINTKRVGSRSFMNLMLLNSGGSSYSCISLQQDSGKYYFKEYVDTDSALLKEIELDEWHHVKLIMNSSSGVSVSIDGAPASTEVKNGTAKFPISKITFQIGHGEAAGCEVYVDNLRAVQADGTVVYEQDFDGETVGSCPSEFTTTCRSGYTLDNTLVCVEKKVKESDSNTDISEDFDSISIGSLPENFTVSDSKMARVENEITPKNALHISNSDTEDRFWCEVSTTLVSAISNGFVEFDVRTERVGSRSFMNLMLLNSGGNYYSNIALQQNSGKYYFNKVAVTDSTAPVHLKEIELGEWHHVKLIMNSSSGVSVSIDGEPISTEVNNGAAKFPISKITFQVGHGEAAGCEVYVDNLRAVTSDGTVVYEQNFDSATVGSCPSEFTTACRSGYTLDNTTVHVVNAVPLLNEPKTLHFVGKSGAGNKAVTATYNFTAVTNADIEFDYTPIAMGTESNCRQGLVIGGAQIGVVQSALRTGDLTSAVYNIKSGVKTVTLGETYRFKVSVDESEGIKLYVNGELCSGDGDSALAAIKSVNQLYFYLDHVQNSAAEMKIGNVKITKHTGEVVYSETFDKMISGKEPTGWTISNGNAAYLSALVAGTTYIPADGNILRVEDSTSNAAVYATMELEERSKAEISFFYKAEKLTDGHVFAVKDSLGNNKVVLRAVPVTEKTAKLQYLAENGKYVDIENSEFDIGSWNELELTVYGNYGKADISLGGLELGEVYSNIDIDEFAILEVGSASVEGVADTFCIDNVSVKSDKVPNKVPIVSSMNENKTVTAGSSLNYNFDTVCSGRFTFVLKSSELTDTVLSLADGDILGTQIKIGADGALCYLRDSIWMAFTSVGVIDTDDGKEHTIVLDVPLERNVGYVNVFVDGALVGTAFYNISFEEITGLKVTAPAANEVTVSSISVDVSQGIFATPEEEEKTVSPYYSEIISGTRGMYALGDSSGKAAMTYFDGSNLETVTFDANYNSIGIDLGARQQVNTVRIRFNNIDSDYLANTKINAHWGNMYVYVSDDNVNYTRLGSTSRNTVDDGNDVIMSFDFSGIEARYVKVNYNRTKSVDGELIADVDNATVSATRRITRQWAMAGDIIYNAEDSAPTSGKMYDVNDITAPITLVKNSSIGIDFGLISDVEAVELIGEGTATLGASDFAVYSSKDNVTYEKIDVTSISRDTRNGKSVIRFNFNSIKANHLKINVVSDISVALESAMKGIAAYSSVEASASIVHMKSTSDRGSEGGFFTCEDGTLVMCHIEYDSGTHGDNAPAHISVRRSTDGGVTWTDPVTVVEKVDETSLNVFVPTFVKLDDGMVGMVFMEKFASYDSAVYIITSDNEGETWSERKKIASTAGDIGYFCLSSGSPAYRAPNGRILVSFAYSVYEREAYGSDRCYGYVVYSDDNGETWTRSKNSFTVPEGVMEPAMSATPDGKLIMTMTTRNVGHIYRSISEDNGETWSQPVPLQDDFCTSHLTQGHVLIPGTDHMVYICSNDQAVANGLKTPLVSAITADNGVSYHNIRNLTEGAGGNTQWPVVKIYGRKVIIQNSYSCITVKALDIAEFYHSVTGDISTLPVAATPTAVYDESTRTLSGVNSDTAISLDGGESWMFVGGSSVTFEQSLMQTARTILVKNVGNTEYAPSGVQTIEAHDFDGDTCKNCGATCIHKWTDGVCEYCGAGCEHVFEFSIYTGLYYCAACGENCPHDWTSGICTDCGLTCVHDWKYTDTASTCSICQKSCTNHTTLDLDFKCAVCQKDTGADNSFSAGGKTLNDIDFMLGHTDNVTVAFDFTVGSADTVMNVKDASRNDNVYYSTDEHSNNPTNPYYSFLTWMRNSGGGTGFLNFASLWMDTENNKLYLTAAGDSSKKISEIVGGKSYSFLVNLNPKTGKYTVTLSTEGEETATYSGSIGAFSGQLVSSTLRFGEALGSKPLHIQKISYENITVELSTPQNSVYANSGVECEHRYNIGGHCHICGVLGDPITFGDGKNGGGNVTDTVKNAQPLTVGDGVYSQDNGGYRQCWDFRDEEGILLGHDYVFEGKFTFNEFVHDSTSKNGITNLLIWSDGDIGVDNNKFLVMLYTDNGKPELGLSATERMELELGKEYDIRVAVRSDELSDGIYTNRAEVSVNGQLMWIKSFTLTSEDGMSIRLGDHVARTSKVKYDVKNDFGIHFIDSSIEYIGSQEKENANYNYDSSYDIRFIFGIEDLYLSDVGVKVEAEVSGGSMYDEVSGEMTISSSRTVLTEIMADGKVCKPVVNGAGGGNYLALAINDIPLDTSATYTFTLTPYVTYHGGETVFSETSHKITVTFDNYKMKMTYGGAHSTPEAASTTTVLASDLGIVPGNVTEVQLNSLVKMASEGSYTFKFDSGVYIFPKTIELPSNTTVMGDADTVFMLSEGASGKSASPSVISIGDGINNVRISNLTVKGYNNTVFCPTYAENNIGIRIHKALRVNIDHVNVVGFADSGIKVTQMGYIFYSNTLTYDERQAYFKNLQISDCRIEKSYYGLNLGDHAEYCQIANLAAGYNNVGCVNSGGNNSFVNCLFNKNNTGYYLLCTNMGNPGHGGATGCAFNHNNQNSLVIEGNQIGFSFTGCQFFDGKIIQTDSCGTLFSSCILGSVKLEASGTAGSGIFTACFFQTDRDTILAGNNGVFTVADCVDVPVTATALVSEQTTEPQMMLLSSVATSKLPKIYSGSTTLMASDFGVVAGNVSESSLNALINKAQEGGYTFKFDSGVYIFPKTVVLPSNTTFVGDAGTVLMLSPSASGSVIEIGKFVDNVKITNLTVKGYNDEAYPAYASGKVGIYIYNALKVNLDGVTVTGFAEAGIKAETMGLIFWDNTLTDDQKQAYFKSLQLSNCRVENNYVGLNLGNHAEYCQITNLSAGYNNIGCVNSGGNNSFVNCIFNNNNTGFSLDCVNMPNHGHGGASGCSFIKNNDKAIAINGNTLGYTFNACNIQGKIISQDSVGIIFNVCIIDSSLEASGAAGSGIFYGCRIKNESSLLSGADGVFTVSDCIGFDNGITVPETAYEPMLNTPEMGKTIEVSSLGILPGAVSDEALDALVALAANGGYTLKFDSGVYEFSKSFEIPSNTSVMGCANTVFKLTGANVGKVPVISVVGVDNVRLESLIVLGELTQNYIENTSIASKAGSVGIYINNSLRVSLGNVTSKNFWDAAVKIENVGLSGYCETVKISNCRFENSYYGLQLAENANFCQIEGSVMGYCASGCIDSGANNLFANCAFNNNRVGFYVYHSNFANAGAGTVINSCFNHNVSYALRIDDCSSGYSFSGCQMFYGTIFHRKNSSGIIISSTVLGSLKLEAINSSADSCQFVGCFFQTDKNAILEKNNSVYKVVDCVEVP